MKKYLMFLIILLSNSSSHPCPTCVGRITKESKPFFSNEFYVSHKSMDHLYQAIRQAELDQQKKEGKTNDQKVATNSTAPLFDTTRKEQQ